MEVGKTGDPCRVSEAAINALWFDADMRKDEDLGKLSKKKYETYGIFHMLVDQMSKK